VTPVSQSSQTNSDPDLSDLGPPPVESPGGGQGRDVDLSDLGPSPSTGSSPAPQASPPQGMSPSPSPPSTPETDKAINIMSDPGSFLNKLLTQPGPEVALARKNFVPGASADQVNFGNIMEMTGRPVAGPFPRPGGADAPVWSQYLFGKTPETGNFVQTQARGAANTGAALMDFVTSPRGLLELGATALFPPAGLAFLGAEFAPGGKDFLKKNWQAATNQLSPAESAQTAWEDAALLVPGAHWAAKKAFPTTSFQPVPLPRKGYIVPPLAFTRERPGVKYTTPNEEKPSGESVSEPMVELKGSDIPADVEAQVKIGDITAVHDPIRNETRYYKPKKGEPADAAKTGTEQTGDETKSEGAAAGAAVSTDAEKVRTTESKPADGGDSTGATAEVPVGQYGVIKQQGVWLVVKKGDPPDLDEGRFTGDQGQERAQAQADYLNKKQADKSEQASQAATAKTAAGPDIAIEANADGTYNIVDKRQRNIPPLFVAKTLKEAHEERQKAEDNQAKASGLEQRDMGMGPIWVYDVPTQNAIKRMQEATALRDSGQPIPDTMQSMMESDYNDLTKKGVDMTPFERKQAPPPATKENTTPLKESPPDTPDTHDAPIEKLLSPDKWKTYQALEAEWGRLDNEGVKLSGNRDKQQPIVERQIEIRKQQRALESELPGGKDQDVIILGSGNTGLQGAISASAEGHNVTVLESGPDYGGATNQTVLENTMGTNPFGDMGASVALNSRQRAMRMGAQFEKVRGIAGEPVQDPVTKMWTIRTLGPGPNGEGGQTFTGRTILVATGVRGRGLPFDIVDSNNKIVTERGVTGTPGDESGVKIYDKATGAISAMRKAKAAGKEGSAIFLGGANSSIQGALSAAESGAGPVHVIYRSGIPEASDYLRPRLEDAIKNKKLVLHPYEQIVSIEAPSDANGNRVIAHTRKTITNADGSVKLDSDKNPVTEAATVKADTVAQFMGGIPASDFMPAAALRSKVKPFGAIVTNDKLQVLKRENVGFTGAKTNVPMDGLYAGGTVRFGATNRAPSAQGEGSTAVANIGQYLLDNEKDMPQWKRDLRATFNSQEYGLPGRSTQPLPEDAPPAGGEPKTDTTAFWKPSFERTGQKTFVNGRWVYVDAQGNPSMTGGKVEKPPPTSLKPPPKKLPPPPAPPSDQQQRQAAGAEEVAAGGAARPGPGLPVESVEAPRPESRAQARPPSEPGMIAEPKAKPNYGPRVNDTPGMVERGNIDYNTRAPVYNDDAPAVRSIPIRNERGSVVIPTVDEAGHPLTVPQAISRYRDTGQHLGVFSDNGAANDFIAANEPRPVLSREDIQTQARARTAANPYYPDRLVKELGTGERTHLDPIEEQAVVDRRGLLANSRDQAGKVALNAKITPGERASAAADFEKADNGIRQMEEATNNGDKIRGKANQLQWHQFRAKDYDVPAMEQKLAIAKQGEPVTPAETADLTRKVAKLGRAQAALEREKVSSGWRPGQGKGGDVGQVRHRQEDVFKAKQALDETVFNQVLKHQNKLQKTFRFYRNVAGVSRSIMTADLTSALLRQGGLLFSGHPLRSLGLMKDTFSSAKSDFNYFKLMQDIRERPNASLYQQSKLGLTDIKNPKMSQLEEAYMSAWVDKIPLLNHSQRAYVYFLNRLRADTFDVMADSVAEKAGAQLTLDQAKGLSNFINVFTGRGHIPEQYAGGIAALNELFFAPRYVMSRFQALTFQPLRYAKDAAVRKAIAWEYGRTLVGYSVVYGLINMLGKQAGVSIEKNPLSTDFGKIKIGNTRIDLLAGLAQTLTIMSRFGTHDTKTSSGQIVSLKQGPGRPFTARNLPGVVWDFLRTKFAPVPSAILNAQAGQKVTGEPATWAGELGGLVLPLNGMDIYKATVEHGLAAGVAIAVLENFGASVNTYSSHVKTPSRKPHRGRH
jgi:thioredoxin reductase